MGSEMGMGDVEVLLRVAGDSSGAQKAVSDWEQKVRSGTATATELFAVNARKMGKSSDDVRASLQAMGATAKEQSLAMATAFGEVPAAIEPAKASVNSFGQAVRSNLGDLLVLRRAMYASFGLVSFGYIISEWGRMADGIKNAALAIGGFSSAAQKAFQQDIKASDDALIHFQGNTIKAQIATGQFLIHQTEMWQAAVEAQRKAADYRERFDEAILGPFVGRAFEYFTGNKLGKANDEAAKLNQRLVAQLQEMTKLEKQLQEEQTKAVVAAAHKQETAEHRLEASLIRVNGQLAAAQKAQAVACHGSCQSRPSEPEGRTRSGHNPNETDRNCYGGRRNHLRLSLAAFKAEDCMSFCTANWGCVSRRGRAHTCRREIQPVFDDGMGSAKYRRSLPRLYQRCRRIEVTVFWYQVKGDSLHRSHEL